MKRNLNLLAFSFAKRALNRGSQEQVRMETYGQHLGSYHVIVFTKRADGFSEPVVLDHTIFYPTNTRTKIGALIKAFMLAYRILRDRVPAPWVVVSQDPFETCFLARLLQQFFSFSHHVEVHGDVFNLPASQKTVLTKIRLRYAKSVLPKLNSVRVVSQRIKESLVTLGVAEAKISVLPIFFSIDSYLSLGTQRTYGRTPRVELLFVGRLEPEKNIPLLIRSMAYLKEQGKAVHLSIVGDGGLRAMLEAMVLERGLTEGVSFSGWQEDLLPYYARADVFTFSSNHEGWGMVLVEAMAAGLPIVTTNVGCVGEAVLADQHALVTAVGQEEAFYEALLRMVNESELRERLGRAAHQQAKVITPAPHAYVEKWVDVITQAVK